ncbi:hypothetical protein FKW77_009646 [Venturia effusa]|uniref:C2H2-type domain-containing protein n=1 Tax=Venturia effusa TaxID=50376 RepID=A0A517L229_9PEZI|nr:hypothetical protein FKW77_009646 [Venturia effusa]
MSNIATFDLKEWMDFPDYGSAFEGYADTQASFENQNHFDTGYDQLVPMTIDGQYRLPEFSPYNAFLDVPVGNFPSPASTGHNVPLRQHDQKLYSSNILAQPVASGQQYQAPVQPGYEGFLQNDYASPQYGQPFVPSHDLTPFNGTWGSGLSPSQRSIASPGTCNSAPSAGCQEVSHSASLSHLDRPLGPGEILAQASQPMFDTRAKFLDHQQGHYDQICKARPVDTEYRCGWHACKTGHTFQNKPALRRHVKQHIKPYMCTAPSCGLYFSRKSDVERHVRTKHSQHLLYCPVEECDRHIHGFPRKDKLDEHTRKAHDNFLCKFAHCKAQVLESAREEHVADFHSGRKTARASEKTREYYFFEEIEGIFECSLPGCESTTSRFNSKLAYRHLRFAHSMDGWYSDSVVRRSARDTTVSGTAENPFIIKNHDGRKVSPCKVCAGSTTVPALEKVSGSVLGEGAN